MPNTLLWTGDGLILGFSPGHVRFRRLVGNILNLCVEFPEKCTLQGIREVFPEHQYRQVVLHFQIPNPDAVLDQEIPHPDILCPLHTRPAPVLLQQHRANIILKHDHLVDGEILLLD